ncbi:alkanesulfonate monooxygenase SsuD/methylene tetrahydromethanopterin reductase-like flavin-dependent oxidoreductase (luciferase family) [Sphingobium subterraneum]|uniref:Alkanesulfonate monooxygenase SsuD/methylene tetrahydromethanopterin reductase-like flavin-dependent oxidoreductase (Luciferase family) n=1 Tax=Sphingobium subterraneum TaxID=627688 RepID=A0A841J233_9SPHN|nr:alkanesulfonate monooxygenase SsuD/methylene tetrahydromethanopterin reductase-like flavin-dependent oxidoreductase (luciferase family) [Sphingobium subterraneum]
MLEPFTFAAGIAQATRHAAVFATSHAPTVHPVMAAKMASTVDIISGGRFVLNVVGGWNKPELEMFGAPLREHDQRYEYLAEWLKIMERLWADPNEFDFHGEFLSINRGSSMPKPLQQPRIPIMNAGGSDRGRSFACEHADMCFIIIKSEDPEKIRAEVQSYRSEARDRFGREIGIWTIGSVIQRDTVEEAEAYLRHVTIDQQDVRVADAWMELQLEHAQLMAPEKMAAFRRRFVEGAGGFPLVGTADDICERFDLLADCGIDGVLLTWVDYIDGLNRFVADVLPQMEAAGLRAPFHPTIPSAPVADIFPSAIRQGEFS